MPFLRFFLRAYLPIETQRTPRCARDMRRAALGTSHAVQHLPCNTEHGHVSRDRPGAHASMARTVPSVGLCAAQECSGTGVPPPSRASCAALPSRAQSMSDQVTTLVTRARRSIHKRRYVHLRTRPAPGPGPPHARRRCTCIHKRRRAHPQDRNNGRG